MILHPIEPDSFVKDLKEKFFELQLRLLEVFQPPSELFSLLGSSIGLLPCASILFSSSPNNVTTSIFKLFLINELCARLSLNKILIDVILLALLTLLLSLFVWCLFVRKVPNSIFKILQILLIAAAFFCVPISYDIFLELRNQQTNLLSTVICVLKITLGFCAYMLTLLWSYLNLAIFRRKSKFWHLTNGVQTLGLLGDIFTAAVIVFSKEASVLTLLCHLLFQLYRCQYNERSSQIFSLISLNQPLLLVLIDFGLICSKVFTAYELSCLYGTLISIIVSCLYTAMRVYAATTASISLPSCSDAQFAMKIYGCYYMHLEAQELFSRFKVQSQQVQFSRNVFGIHRFHCKSQSCHVRNIDPRVHSSELQTIKSFDEFVQSYLFLTRQVDLDSKLLYMLWLTEKGRKYELEYEPWGLPFRLSFIRFYLKNGSNGAASGAQQSEEIGMLHQTFGREFELLMWSATTNINSLYRQIQKGRPGIGEILWHGEQIVDFVTRLRAIFVRSLKSNALNFKAIEIYIEMMLYLLNDNFMDKQLLQKLSELQKDIGMAATDSCYLPTLTILPENGMVDGANMQCLKLLKATKYELKSKRIGSLIYPSFDLATSVTNSNNSEDSQDNNLVFVRRFTNEFVCARIAFVEKYSKSKKLIACVLEPDKYSDCRNHILVDDQFRPVVFLRTRTYYRTHAVRRSFIFDWVSIFEKYIKPAKQQLTTKQMCKVTVSECGGAVVLIISRPTLNSAFKLITVKVLRNIEPANLNRNSVILQHMHLQKQTLMKFSFSYNQVSENATLTGIFKKDEIQVQSYIQEPPASNKQPALNEAKDDTVIQQRIQPLLIKNTPNYAQGISVYRLYGGELYNIDLEDREAYNELFEGHESKEKATKQQQQQLGDSNDYFVILVFIVALTMLAASIFNLVAIDSLNSSLSASFVKRQKVEAFRLNFNRITSTLRDFSNGLFESYSLEMKPVVLESVSEIEKIRSEVIFSMKEQQLKYDRISYIGNINQLVDVAMAHVYEFLQTNNSSIVQLIHDYVILGLDDLIQSEKNSLLSKSDQTIQELSRLSLFLLISLIIGAFVFYILLSQLCLRLTDRMKGKFRELMILSDSQAQEYQENAQKVQHFLEMFNKNFEFDVQNILVKAESHRKRAKPKEAELGFSTVIKMIIALAGSLLILVCIIVVTLVFSQQAFIDFQELQTYTDAIVNSYTSLCAESNRIDHTLEVRPQIINTIMAYIGTIRSHKLSTVLSPELSNKTLTIFFNSSCQIIKDYKALTTGTTCAKTTPGFILENPFEIGLVLYFTRIHFDLTNNITNTFACTGIFSSPFARIFNSLSSDIQKEGVIFLVQMRKYLFLLNTIVMSICIIQCIASYVIDTKLKSKINQVRNLVAFLNLQGLPKRPAPVLKSLISKRDSRKDRVRRRSKHRTTIESMSEADVLNNIIV